MNRSEFLIGEVMEHLVSNAIDLQERMRLIFKYNNVLLLESELRCMTEDKSYSIDTDRVCDGIVFINDVGNEIEIIEDNIDVKGEGVPVEFKDLVISRLSRTSEMLNGLACL